MEEQKVEIKKFKKEARKRKIKEQVKSKLNNAGQWINRNKETLAMVLPIASAGISVVAKTINGRQRKRDLKKSQETMELYVYDRSLGHYWKLKRPLKNSDWVEINDRKRNGETLGEILKSLHVLE